MLLKAERKMRIPYSDEVTICDETDEVTIGDDLDEVTICDDTEEVNIRDDTDGMFNLPSSMHALPD